jgi:glycosyltransferase involved in cell wall biosynthesis
VSQNFYNTGSFLHEKKKFISFILFVLSWVRMAIYGFWLSGRVDLIYSIDHLAGFACLPSRKLFRKKLVLEINGLAVLDRVFYRSGLPAQFGKPALILERLYQNFVCWVEKITVRGADCIIAVTESLKSALNRIYNVGVDLSARFGKPTPIHVIANGVNHQYFHPEQDTREREGIWDKILSQGERKITPDSQIICFVGVLSPWQGIETLIASTSLLLEKEEDVQVFIIGDGDSRRYIEGIVSTSGLEGHILFMGAIPYVELGSYIRLSSVCVAPYRKDKHGSPLKVNEYLACGKPVVASRMPGLEFIEKRSIGILVNPEDPNGLAGGILRLLKNEEERREMGERALIYTQDLGWDKVVERIDKVLKLVIGY